MARDIFVKYSCRSHRDFFNDLLAAQSASCLIMGVSAMEKAEWLIKFYTPVPVSARRWTRRIDHGSGTVFAIT